MRSTKTTQHIEIIRKTGKMATYNSIYWQLALDCAVKHLVNGDPSGFWQ